MGFRANFHSTSNLRAFEEFLDAKGVEFFTMGYLCSVRGADGSLEDEALALGATIVASDHDGGTTSGVDGWQDMQSTAARSSPPAVIRAPPPLTYGMNQIVSQPGFEPQKPPGAFPARRKTLGQP